MNNNTPFWVFTERMNNTPFEFSWMGRVRFLIPSLSPTRGARQQLTGAPDRTRRHARHVATHPNSGEASLGTTGKQQP